MTTILSINELYSIKQNIDKNHIKTYNKVVELCNKKIKRIAEHNGYSTFYSVPYYIIGYPLFNVEECIRHLMMLYKKSNYIVNRLPEPNRNILYISWDPSELTTTKTKKKTLGFN
jgi:hypothetical protein